MSKKIRNKKAILITVIAVLFVTVALYFYCDKPIEKTNSSKVDAAALEIIRQAQNHEAEAHAKEEFVHDEMMCEEDEDVAKEEFVHNEITRDQDESEEKAEKEGDLAHDDNLQVEAEHPAKEKEEVAQGDITPAEYEIAPTQDKKESAAETSIQDDKAALEENTKPSPKNKELTPDVDTTPKSLFSTAAHILSVVISNNDAVQTENEVDPYEEVVAPHKIEVLSPAVAVPPKTPPQEAVVPSKVELEALAEKQGEHSKAYLNATSSVSHLMTKFLQKADYTKELSSIDQTKLPPEVKEILAEMKDFAENQMKAPEDSNAKIFPKEGVLDRIAGHFVQIERVSDSKSKNERYEQICKKLHILEDYFYSQKFLNEMMGHD